MFLLCREHDPCSMYLGAIIRGTGIFTVCGFGSHTGIDAATLPITTANVALRKCPSCLASNSFLKFPLHPCQSRPRPRPNLDYTLLQHLSCNVLASATFPQRPHSQDRNDLNLPWRLQHADCATLIFVAAFACGAHTFLAFSPPYIPALTKVDEEIELVGVVRRLNIGTDPRISEVVGHCLQLSVTRRISFWISEGVSLSRSCSDFDIYVAMLVILP